MLIDRGKKWNTSLMLTEHVSMLKEFYEEANDVKKPLVDEHQLEEMNSTFQVCNLKLGYPKCKVNPKQSFHFLYSFIRAIDTISLYNLT